jgi:hypothetical protein
MYAFFVPSLEPMHLTLLKPVALVDRCALMQSLTSPIRLESTVGYDYRGDGEGFENLYDGSDKDKDWLC